MSQEPSGPSVLVVDDDPEIVTLLTTRLGHRGYRVSSASDGHLALELARRDHPDVMLLDVMMPGKSGWEVVKALKQDPDTQHIKVVMFTAMGTKVNDLTSMIAGADAHLDKLPFELDKIERVIRELITPPA